MSTLDLLLKLASLNELELTLAMKGTDNPKFKEILQNVINLRFPKKK